MYDIFMDVKSISGGNYKHPLFQSICKYYLNNNEFLFSAILCLKHSIGSSVLYNIGPVHELTSSSLLRYVRLPI